MKKPKTVGSVIRAARERAGFSSPEAFCDAHPVVHVQVLRKVESGERECPRLDTLLKIAGALDLSLGDFDGCTFQKNHEKSTRSG